MKVDRETLILPLGISKNLQYLERASWNLLVAKVDVCVVDAWL